MCIVMQFGMIFQHMHSLCAKLTNVIFPCPRKVLFLAFELRKPNLIVRNIWKII